MAQAVAERVLPSGRLCLRTGRQAMDDYFGRDERERYDAAEEVVVGRDAYLLRSVERQCVVGNEIGLRGTSTSNLEVDAAVRAEKRGKPSSERALCVALVPRPPAFRTARLSHRSDTRPRSPGSR